MIVGTNPAVNGTILVTIHLHFKAVLEIEWTINYKIYIQKFATYNKNNNAVYRVVHGNLCGQVIARYKNDSNYDTVYDNNGSTGLLNIL